MPTFTPSPQADSTLLSMTPMATDLSSEQLRHAWDGKIRDAALFSARTTEESYLQMVRKFLGQVASGTLTPQVAKSKLRQTLEGIGYRPETGFPGDGGKVPPATPQSIEDMSSSRRMELILDTNIKQARSLGQIASSENPVNLFSIPAWKLTRTGARKKPRGDWRRRWQAAGNACGWEGAAKSVLVALKTSPIWGQLAKGAGGFRDTIGTDYPPFAFGSGMAWVGVSRREWMGICERENMPSGDEARMEAAREFRRNRERQQPQTPEKRPVMPGRENPSTHAPAAGGRPKSPFAGESRDDGAASAVEVKARAKKAIADARGRVAAMGRIISERYAPFAERMLESVGRYGGRFSLPASDGSGKVSSALEQYASSQRRLAEFNHTLARMYIAVLNLSPANMPASEFEARMDRYIAASGRQERLAKDEFDRCRDENAMLEAVAGRFGQRVTAARRM